VGARKGHVRKPSAESATTEPVGRWLVTLRLGADPSTRLPGSCGVVRAGVSRCCGGRCAGGDVRYREHQTGGRNQHHRWVHVNLPGRPASSPRCPVAGRSHTNAAVKLRSQSETLVSAANGNVGQSCRSRWTIGSCSPTARYPAVVPSQSKFMNLLNLRAARGWLRL